MEGETSGSVHYTPPYDRPTFSLFQELFQKCDALSVLWDQPVGAFSQRRGSPYATLQYVDKAPGMRPAHV